MNKTAINSNSSVTISKSEDDSPPRIVPITKPDHELKDEQIPSKSLQIDKIKVPKDGELPKLEVDFKFIDNVYHREEAKLLVNGHHVHKFVAEYAEIIERLKCYLEFTKDWIHHLETRIAYYSGQLWKTNEFQKREREGSSNVPWSVLDRFTQITFSIFSFALLGIGINTLATYLMGSGYIVFLEKPVLAYILSAVNIGVAVILKIGSAWCNNDSSKRRYFLCLWVAGLLSGLTWLGSFSILFPNIGIEGIEGIIAGLSSETSAFKGALERIFVASQLVAEVCIAAALWIYLERLSLKHGPLFTVEKNPVYQLYFNNLSDLNKKLLKAADKEGAIGGCLKKIEAKKYVLLTSAVSALSAKQRSMAEKIYNLDGESLNL